MTKLSSVSLRNNQYTFDSKFSKMMTKQTRMSRQRRDLEKANLGLYLNIVHTKPSVDKVDNLRMGESKRSRMVGILSKRVANAGRVKSLADTLLRQRYGTTGSSNRLFKSCKECLDCKRETHTHCKMNATNDNKSHVMSFDTAMQRQ